MDIHNFYATSLRGSLFSGFLTLSGFLFSMHAFIVLNMKKELYDTKAYKTLVSSGRQQNPSLSVYGPLKRLSGLLMKALCFCLGTSVCQLTIGFVPNTYATVFCLALPILTVALLAFVVYIISENLRSLFDSLEHAANAEGMKTESPKCICPYLTGTLTAKDGCAQAKQ